MQCSLPVAALLFVGLAVLGQVRAADPLEKSELRLLRQYEKHVAGALANSTNGCIDCHSSQSMSNLVLTGNSLEDLRHLLDDGYLRTAGPDTLLGRVKNAHPDRRMPKDAEPWDRGQIRKLEKFLKSVQAQEHASGVATDEQFPRSLLSPFDESTVPSTRPAPTQFLSYWQLRGKVKAIFHDDWVRGDRDLFSENIAAFSGADFKTRFNESTDPSASFLSALEVLSRDVASRAYRQKLGPFADWNEPLDAATSASDLQQAIETVYQRVLFRSPSEQESRHALELLQGVQDLEQTIAERHTELVFEVTVTDPTTSLTSQATISIPVNGDRLGIQQSIIDQRANTQSETSDSDSDSKHGRRLLGRISLGPNHPGRVVLHNKGTYRNVSFAGVELRDSHGDLVRIVNVDSSDVTVDGAWVPSEQGDLKYLEDKNQHKGLSTITVTLTSDMDQEIDVIARWIPDARNADNVLCELFGDNVEPHRGLQSPQQYDIPETGTAVFHFDCSNDTVPFVELPGVFQFGAQNYVEITNEHTLEQVTAGGIEFINQADTKNRFLIDSKAAQGVDLWEKFDEGRFKAYNVRGQKVHDGNQHKGQRSLKYMLDDHADSDWREDQLYRVRVYYPGKRDQEPRVPVFVHAQKSSPIIQVAHPLTARADATVRLDASQSYTVQHSELQFQWRQVAGPAVAVDDWTLPQLEFSAPRQSARELAWVSLCGALMRHPDFLFTHAPSIATTPARERERLLLSKIALDLVGRPPTDAEFKRLESGATLEQFVDSYLESPEFRDFYFHRVRLYLESQGTALQDEPARLWSYVAFNDRPFQEILTAEYTVDENFSQIERPAYHGRTGVLTTKGFIDGKPGLPHYNYAAQVSMLFLGYVYEVPPEIVEQREGVTALGTADPNSSCYSCHKILTPLAFQRENWTDTGEYRTQDESGLEIDATDRNIVDEYPFKGNGLEAFATQAVRKERFVRTIINTHVDFYFGRQMYHRDHERTLYKKLWDNVHESNFQIRPLIKAIVTSAEYFGN
ncbi:MAG: hypothetical protein R3C53_24865 [Pirellulaceae bacterium]